MNHWISLRFDLQELQEVLEEEYFLHQGRKSNKLRLHCALGDMLLLPGAKIKSYVNHWLREIPEVLAYHSAQRHHGGVGAVYVLLRKSEQKKQQNRERFRK